MHMELGSHRCLINHTSTTCDPTAYISKFVILLNCLQRIDKWYVYTIRNFEALKCITSLNIIQKSFTIFVLPGNKFFFNKSTTQS